MRFCPLDNNLFLRKIPNYLIDFSDVLFDLPMLLSAVSIGIEKFFLIHIRVQSSCPLDSRKVHAVDLNPKMWQFNYLQKMPALPNIGYENYELCRRLLDILVALHSIVINTISWPFSVGKDSGVCSGWARCSLLTQPNSKKISSMIMVINNYYVAIL